MNKKAIYGISIAIVLPVLAYLMTDLFAKKHVALPPKYGFERVEKVERRGRMVDDSIFHKVTNYRMVNQLGDTVNLNDVQGKILVVDFFFTSCASICPGMTATMQKLQKSFDAKSAKDVHFLSVSIDPLHDTPQKMKAYADQYNIKHNNWWMLQGDTATLYNWCSKEFLLGAANPNGDPNAQNVHTDMFVLLDRQRVIRGYYHSKQKEAMAKLAHDIAMLMMEEDKNRKGLFD
jgi:protein SCO1